MASGTPVQILQVMYPATLFAPAALITGAATPAERVQVLGAFDAAAIEYLDFLCRLQGYGGGGLTWQIAWAAASGTTNETRWGVAVRRLQDDAEDIDTTAHSYDYNSVDATAPNAVGEVAYDTVTMTDGADMDSWANGELAIVRVRREATHANDDMTGDAYLIGFTGIET
jgi:hypothetical protein